MKDMSAVVISDSGRLYVADKTILVFNVKTGELCQEFGRVKESGGAGGSKGRYSGLALTKDGALIAARTEKAGCVLKVGLIKRKDSKLMILLLPGDECGGRNGQVSH